jgi:sialic acid synthase SpsE
MDFAFATIVTIANVKSGEIFTKDNIWVKRPGIGGMPAEQYNDLLGKRAARDIKSDQHLQSEDVIDPTGNA